MTEVALDTAARRPAAPTRVRAGRPGGAWLRRSMVTPTVLATLVIGAYPLVFILLTAFSESSLGRPFQAWVGGANLAEVLTDGDVTASLLRNTVYAVIVTAASVALGVVTALALRSATSRGSLVRTLLLLPLITPPVIVGVLWKLIFNPSGGLLNTVLGLFGYAGDPVAVLSNPAWALVGIGVADVWEWTPLVALLVFAALLGQDREVAEAAALDGAHGFRFFRSITLPAIAGTVAAAFLIRLVLAFKVFDLVFVLTSGGPGTSTSVPAYLIYQAALQQFDLGRASAITLLLAVVVTVVTLPVIAIARRLHND
ncbi:sugar ABC transporter permease [Leifsonia sp. F6_8S_P_1B]|uniref:Sugar ABC transporter permease n=1 Tax=Leifsonia williamsii TaxID=3035919 RepID=A0ABT8KH20_9MICO|nr:sugar ABC transporter permease [Leifsonia williamsii]MDN4616297.1 sugar ABC transporter permease [Leifsonia williamsii]